MIRIISNFIMPSFSKFFLILRNSSGIQTEMPRPTPYKVMALPKSNPKNLHVLYHPRITTARKLFITLTQFGTIVTFFTYPSPVGDLEERFAFVTFQNEREADGAFALLQGLRLEKRKE